MIQIKTIVLSVMQTNCYLIYDSTTKHALIVDPSIDKDSKVSTFIDENGLIPLGILITHAHFDHIGSVDDLRNKYGIKAYSSKIEANNAKDIRFNLSKTFVRDFDITATIEEVLTDGQEVDFGGILIRCIEVPGHSDQSICYYIKQITSLISGDTVFYGDTGRTDLYNGPDTDLILNIRNKLFILPEETIVYPGHGPSTTIGREIKNTSNY